jgi:hypothetical protein
MIHLLREFESNEPAFFKLLIYSVVYTDYDGIVCSL